MFRTEETDAEEEQKLHHRTRLIPETQHTTNYRATHATHHKLQLPLGARSEEEAGSSSLSGDGWLKLTMLVSYG